MEILNLSRCKGKKIRKKDLLAKLFFKRSSKLFFNYAKNMLTKMECYEKRNQIFMNLHGNRVPKERLRNLRNMAM